MSKKLLLIGGGGHAKSVIDSLSSSNQFEEIGIIVNDLPIGSKILGIKVMGSDEELEALKDQGFDHAFVTVGSIGDTSLRRRITGYLITKGFDIPNIIDKTATISKFSTIGKGNFIGKHAIVNANVQVGDYNIINTATILDHDCKVSNFVHISPGSVLNGGVTVENDSHIGANSSVKQEITIGENALIGMGSVVLHNISNNAIAYGNPCKEVKSK